MAGAGVTEAGWGKQQGSSRRSLSRARVPRGCCLVSCSIRLSLSACSAASLVLPREGERGAEATVAAVPAKAVG